MAAVRSIPVARQWRAVGRAAWTVFNVEDEEALKAAQAAQKGDTSDTGLFVTVHDLASGALVKVSVSETDKASLVMGRACKQLGYKVDSVVFVAGGRKLEGSAPVASILAAGGHVAVVKAGVELEFDPEHKWEKVQVTDDRKEMKAEGSNEYCSVRHQVRCSKPFPTSGRHEFIVQMSGRSRGCYDGIALVTGDRDFSDTGLKRMGDDEWSWSYETSRARMRHNRKDTYMSSPGDCRTKDRLHFVFDSSAGTLSVRRYITSEQRFQSDDYIQIFEDLPSVPLYLAVNICPHGGSTGFRILDDEADALEM